MKKGIIWIMLSWLIVAAFVLSSCGPATPSEQEEEEEEEEEEPVGEQEEEEEEEEETGLPQYGGTLTVAHQWVTDDPPSPAQNDSQIIAIWWLEPIQEHLLIGDLRTYGSMGTGEFMFHFNGFIPPGYKKGQLVESWEINYDEAVLHVRPGIMWQPGNTGIMEARELTAYDIAADINAFWEAPWGGRFDGLLERVYASDKYTVVCEFESFSNQFMYYIGTEDRSVYSPPELEAADASMWENQVGTGPFMFEEYVEGSQMIYARNPNYWDTVTLNGKEYELPFVDKLVYPIIPDEATRAAAMKTGQFDYYVNVPTQHWSLLDDTPDLLSVSRIGGNGMVIGLNSTQPPFDNVSVRQAVMIGTNMKLFSYLYQAEDQPIHWFPVAPGNPGIYMPLEELPTDLQLLYDYDPELAKQMLADAGYPDGFTTSIYSESVPVSLDIAALIVDQWKDIGVEIEIVVNDSAAHTDHKYEVTYEGGIVQSLEVANPIISLTSQGMTDGYINFSGWSNSSFDALMEPLVLELDIDEQNRLSREASKIMLKGAAYIPLTSVVGRGYWWPWLKNFSGEYSLADQGTASIMPYIWIDQVLKKEMGY